MFLLKINIVGIIFLLIHISILNFKILGCFIIIDKNTNLKTNYQRSSWLSVCGPFMRAVLIRVEWAVVCTYTAKGP